MHFEWDEQKAKRNLRKHGISFEDAVSVFYDPLSATFDDPDHSIGERRYITVGVASSGELLVVSHTDRGDAVRVISARRATVHEKKRHED